MTGEAEPTITSPKMHSDPDQDGQGGGGRDPGQRRASGPRPAGPPAGRTGVDG